jgi:long-chain fatty acid transport protein
VKEGLAGLPPGKAPALFGNGAGASLPSFARPLREMVISRRMRGDKEYGSSMSGALATRVAASLRSSIATTAFLGAFFLPGALDTVLADAVLRDSIGAIPAGRGGTNLAFADNLATLYDNPAALSQMSGTRVEVDLGLAKTELNFENALNDEDAKDELFAMPTALISWQFTQVPTPAAIGLGFFVPAGYGAEWSLENPVFGEQTYRSKAGLYKVLSTFSIDIGKGFSVGAGAGFAYETAEFETPYVFQSGAFAGLPGLVDLKTDGFGYAWNVGIQYRPTDRWTIGVAYVSETPVRMEGDFNLDVTGVPLPVPIPDTTAKYKVDLENTWPRTLGVGTSYRLDWGTLALDFYWYDWSNAFDKLTFKLSDGDNPFFNAMAGAHPSDDFPLNWHDSYSVRVGADFYLSENDTLRAGYMYMTNPVPDETLTPLIPANVEHAITVGYGHNFGAVRLDLAYQFYIGRRQDVGSSDISPEYDGSSEQTMAHWFYLGANFNF